MVSSYVKEPAKHTQLQGSYLEPGSGSTGTSFDVEDFDEKSLQQTAATELWAWVEALELEGPSAAGALESLVFPKGFSG